MAVFATKRNVSAARSIVAYATIVAKMSRFHEIGIVVVYSLNRAFDSCIIVIVVSGSSVQCIRTRVPRATGIVRDARRLRSFYSTPLGMAGCSLRSRFVAVLAGFLTIGFAPPAQALPSFARQTGQPCGTCHTDFPALTPYGRRFKLLGYTAGGGEFRTTPFSSQAGSDARAELDKLRGYAKAVNPPATDASKEYVPPISMMAIVGYTHTQGPTVAPPTDPYKANDNVVLSPFSAFWGGAITDNIGAFAQVTYSAPDPLSALSGTPADQFKHTWSWDNADVRYANTANIGRARRGLWHHRQQQSDRSGFVEHHAGVVLPLRRIVTCRHARRQHDDRGRVCRACRRRRRLYDDQRPALSGIDRHTRRSGSASRTRSVSNPFDAPGLFGGVAPYWRVALEPHWGRHSLMVGTFGMYLGCASVARSKLRDGNDRDVSHIGQIHRHRLRLAISVSGRQLLADVARQLYSRVSAAGRELCQFCFVQSDQPAQQPEAAGLVCLWRRQPGRFHRAIFQYLGHRRPTLVRESPSTRTPTTPNSNGWMAEIAYIPFGVSKSIGWPWFNARIGLQYIYYNKFDGSTIGAHDNNTLFLHAWFAM